MKQRSQSFLADFPSDAYSFEATFTDSSDSTDLEFSEAINVISEGLGQYTIGHGLKVVDSVLEVDAVNTVEQDNTLPITSAGVYTVVGNIDALLKTI